ncbi:MAG TPA: class I SAM-dependent methyltransferase [Pirellulales bacterium]|jgi:SAM-dependent methyltransferase|nr:class I SAM-dependent methyltransferase [Pirellulales bacterium]
MPKLSDKWTVGESYEHFMGRWSRLLASRFVSWLPARPNAHWLDVGCGTGALGDAICATAQPASVVGCDLSQPLVEYARQHLVDPRISFVAAGIGQLPTRVGGFDCASSLLALNFFPNPEAAIEEMRSVAAPHGLVSACVWDYAGRMEFLRRFWDSAVAVDPGAAELDEGRRFSICQPDALETLFRRGGLRDIVCDSIEIPTRFSTFADFWTPFMGGTGPAPSYVATLESSRREALAAHLSRSLPRELDGAICLVAAAWAVRGVAS